MHYLLILILMALQGCETSQAIFARPYCVPNSIYNAWTWGAEKKDPVRIAVQNIKPGIDHAQAEAQIQGKWTPLTELWDQQAGYMKIIPFARHFPQEPYRYVPLKQWIDENIIWTNQ
jgi:hypothetical protein